MRSGPNIEKHGVTRAARIQVHHSAYRWGDLPSMKGPQKEARRRRRSRQKSSLIRALSRYEIGDEGFDIQEDNRAVIDWCELD